MNIGWAAGLMMLMILCGCERRELPETMVSEPEFFALGTLDGEPFDLLAGPDGVEVSSDYQLSDESLPIFTSRFEQVACTSCVEGLSLELVAAVEAAPGLDMATYLPVGDYQLVDFMLEQQLTTFAIELVGSSPNSLILTGLIDSLELVVVGSYLEATLPDGEYVANAIYGVSTCPLASIHGFSIRDGAVCGPQIAVDISDSQFSYSLSGPAQGVEVSINDTVVALAPDEPIALADIPDSGALLNVEIIAVTSEGCESSLALTSIAGLSSDCAPQLLVTPLTQPLSREAMTASLRYTDAQGQVHTSADAEMDQLQVLEIIPNGLDPLGREAYRAKVAFEATLQDPQDSSDQLDLIITEAYIPLVVE